MSKEGFGLLLIGLYVKVTQGLRRLKDRLEEQSGYTTWEWLGGGAAIAAMFLALAAAMGGISLKGLAQSIVDWMSAALDKSKPTSTP